MTYQVEHSDAEWRTLLGPGRYRVLRRAGTEPPFDNEYWDQHAAGSYLCGGCGATLFDAGDKYDSGSGWPSFTRPGGPDRIEEHVDDTLGTVRTEVRCARCGSHLGHVFSDGPAPTGQRYCMNSLALTFEPAGS